MKVKNKVRPIANLDASLPLDSSEFEGFELFEEGGEVDYYTVTDDACSHFIEDTAWDKMELVFPSVGYDGVAGVGAAGDAGADVVGLGEDVD